MKSCTRGAGALRGPFCIRHRHAVPLCIRLLCKSYLAGLYLHLWNVLLKMILSSSPNTWLPQVIFTGSTIYSKQIGPLSWIFCVTLARKKCSPDLHDECRRIACLGPLESMFSARCHLCEHPNYNASNPELPMYFICSSSTTRSVVNFNAGASNRACWSPGGVHTVFMTEYILSFWDFGITRVVLRLINISWAQGCIKLQTSHLCKKAVIGANYVLWTDKQSDDGQSCKLSQIRIFWI